MRILIASLLVACGSYTTYQTAETLPPGKWQLSAAVGPGAFNDKPSKVVTPTITLEAAVRRGISDNTDVGLKLYGAGIEASVRYRFFDGEWAWAMLGALNAVHTSGMELGQTEAITTQGRISFAATRRTSQRWAFTLGPSVTGSYFLPAGGGQAAGLLVGGFANAEYSFHEHWHVVPELSLHWTVVGDVPVKGSVAMIGVALARDL